MARRSKAHELDTRTHGTRAPPVDPDDRFGRPGSRRTGDLAGRLDEPRRQRTIGRTPVRTVAAVIATVIATAPLTAVLAAIRTTIIGAARAPVPTPVFTADSGV